MKKECIYLNKVSSISIHQAVRYLFFLLPPRPQMEKAQEPERISQRQRPSGVALRCFRPLRDTPLWVTPSTPQKNTTTIFTWGPGPDIAELSLSARVTLKNCYKTYKYIIMIRIRNTGRLLTLLFHFTTIHWMYF